MSEKNLDIEYDPEAYDALPETEGTELVLPNWYPASPYDGTEPLSDPEGDETGDPNLLRGLRTGEDAVQWALSQHSGYSGYCLIFTRSAFGIGSYWSTAAKAWYNAAHKHPVKRGAQVPRGVPVFWTGGSKGYGHIAVSIGNGLCRSTDWPSRNRISTVAIDRINPAWGQHLMGWTEDLNRVRVWNPAPHSHTDGLVSLTRLKPGKKNLDIREMQRRLIAKGVAEFDDPTGYFGNLTRAAVRRWQYKCGFRGSDADGIPGRLSMRMLGFKVVP